MTGLSDDIAIALATLAGTALMCMFALRGWRDWLEYKRYELQRSERSDDISLSPGARIELADLKERVRNLEAIASGVEL